MIHVVNSFHVLIPVEQRKMILPLCNLLHDGYFCFEIMRYLINQAVLAGSEGEVDTPY